MQLNTPRKSGWKGRYGWRNILDVFIREHEKKKIKKAVKTITKNSTVPTEKSLVLYEPKVMFKPVHIQIPIPHISFKAFIGLLAILCIVLASFLSFAIYIYLKNEIDYRDTVRHQINYNIEKALESYKAKQSELELKVMEYDEIIVINPVFRKKLLENLRKKYDDSFKNENIVEAQ